MQYFHVNLDIFLDLYVKTIHLHFMLLNYVTCPINIELYAKSFIFIFLVFNFYDNIFWLKII